MLKKHKNINNLIKINIHMLLVLPKLIPVSVYIKLEKYFLKENTYWLKTINEEIKIIKREIMLFLKMGLNLKHDMYNNNIKIPPLIK